MTIDRREFHQRAKLVFANSLSIPAEERQEFLRRECAGNKKLLKEVESLLEIDAADLPDDFGVLQPPPHSAISPSKKSPAHHLWVGMVLVSLVGVASIFVAWSLRLRLQHEVCQDLQIVCNTSIHAIQAWENARSREVAQLATDDRILDAAHRLTQLLRDSSDARQSLMESRLVGEFYEASAAYTMAHGGASLHLVSRDGVVLADPDPAYLGAQLSSEAFKYLAPVFDGHAGISPLVQNGAMVQDSPKGISDYPTHSYAFAPIRDESGRVIAVLAAMEFAQSGYGEIIQTGSLSPDLLVTLINDDGRIVSSSDGIDSKVTRPTIASSQSLTRIASALLGNELANQNSGAVLEPYLNHRGRYVVGVWSWVPAGSPTGVIVERDASRAYWSYHWLNSFMILGLCCIAGPPLYFLAPWLWRASQGEFATLDPRYQLIEQIGQGGFSRVYRAKDLRLDREVAIKVLSNDDSDGNSLRRFKREIRILAALTHPATIRVFDSGTCENDVPYFVMELVQGLTLAQLVEQRGRQTEEFALAMMHDICHSLSEAHDAGLVHRDLKPHNIMVSRIGTPEQFFKVLDFGLGKSLPTSNDEQRSTTGQIAGTLQFMAPECILSPDDVGPASDVYSLGAVMLYLLSGQQAFAGDKLKLLDSVTNSKSEGGLLQIGASPRLAEVIQSTLATNPSNRPQNAHKLGEILKRLMPIPH